MKHNYDKYVRNKYVRTKDKDIISYLSDMAITSDNNMCMFKDGEYAYIYNISWFNEHLKYDTSDRWGLYPIHKIEKYVLQYVKRMEKVKNRESVLKDLGI